jgi:hypothetical protein
MEIIGEGLIAVGHAVGAFAWATALVYIAGIVSKTILVMNGDAKPDELKSWTDFQIWKKRDNNRF